MGAYTTLTISRDKAKAHLIEEVLCADDDTLARLLDIALEPRLYNAIVVPITGKDDAEL